MIESIDYLKMTKKIRQKEMIHIIESICNSYMYDDYYRIKKEVEQYAKEQNINENEIEYGEYSEEID